MIEGPIINNEITRIKFLKSSNLGNYVNSI